MGRRRSARQGEVAPRCALRLLSPPPAPLHTAGMSRASTKTTDNATPATTEGEKQTALPVQPAIGTPLTAQTQHVRIGRQTTQATQGGPVRQRKVNGSDEPPPK